METYKLLFENQSIDTKIVYNVVRETKCYLFLEVLTKTPCHIFRVHKKTLIVKGIKNGVNGYKWDVPTAVFLVKL
jgi:hypothetical protein